MLTIESLQKHFSGSAPVMAALLLAGLLFMGGCGGSESEQGASYLIRVGESTLSRLEFNQALEIAKTPYQQELADHPDLLRGLRLQVLEECLERLILLERARELGITVSQEALDRAVEKARAEYSQAEFEQMLLESALSYRRWKAELKTHLLMQAVIAQDLAESITVSPQSIAEYYKSHYSKKKNAKQAQDPDAAIVRELRRKKAQALYPTWLRDLKSRYDIQVNPQGWKRILNPGPSQIQDNHAHESH